VPSSGERAHQLCFFKCPVAHHQCHFVGGFTWALTTDQSKPQKKALITLLRMVV
jgi:hypothetical protein